MTHPDPASSPGSDTTGPIPPSSTDHPLYHAVADACREVYDPEIPVNIFDLGLIYALRIDDTGGVAVTMTLTSPACPVAGEMPGWVAEAVSSVDGAHVTAVDLVWDPPWGLDMMTDEARLELGLM